MKNVLVFFSALSGWEKNKELLFRYTIELQRIESTATIYARPRYLTCLQYFHEAQNAELYKFLHSMVHIDFSDTSSHNPHDIVAVRYLICNKRMKSLALSFISDEHLKPLEHVLKINMPEQLCISNCLHLGHDGWKIIADLMEQTAMKYFSCNFAELASADINCLGIALQCSLLKSLLFSFTNIGDTGIVKLAKYVDTGLSCLGFEFCEITDKGIESLCAILPNTKVTTLNLGGNNITSRGLTVPADALMNTPNFKIIYLQHYKANKIIPGRDMQGFLERLLHHPQLCDIFTSVLSTVSPGPRSYIPAQH